MISDPSELIAHACLPIFLINYGISLHGQRILSASGRQRDVLLAASLKVVVMPIVAWVLAESVFGLRQSDVLVVVVLAAIPSAQNAFNLAQRYQVGETIARDTMFITNIGCVPVLLVITALLGP